MNTTIQSTRDIDVTTTVPLGRSAPPSGLACMGLFNNFGARVGWQRRSAQCRVRSAGKSLQLEDRMYGHGHKPHAMRLNEGRLKMQSMFAAQINPPLQQTNAIETTQARTNNRRRKTWQMLNCPDASIDSVESQLSQMLLGAQNHHVRVGKPEDAVGNEADYFKQ